MADAKAFKVPPIRPANRWFVLVGVTAGLGVSALPLYYKQVRDKEQQLAEARCAAAEELSAQHGHHRHEHVSCLCCHFVQLTRACFGATHETCCGSTQCTICCEEMPRQLEGTQWRSRHLLCVHTSCVSLQSLSQQYS